MRQIFSIVIFCLLVLSSCFPTKNIVETHPIYEGDTVSFQGYVYSLPQTSFKLTLDVLKTRTIRGPYYRFAEKLLSLKDVPERDNDKFRISNVLLESYEEADPDQVYLVKQVSGITDLSSLLRLSEEGLIFDDRETASDKALTRLPGSAIEGPVFTELSMERNTVMSIDTFYKTILTDTSFLRVPVLSEQLIVKTIDEKAEEAADFILELRYERFMMLTGNNAAPVSDFGVRRLDQIEREYLDLFIGKSYEERYRYTYYFTPESTEFFENIEILEFSENRGILDAGAPDSEVLSLRIRNTGKTALLKDPGQTGKLTVKSNALYYRVPDLAEIEINLGGRNLLKDRYKVSQYGEILALPVGPAKD